MNDIAHNNNASTSLTQPGQNHGQNPFLVYGDQVSSRNIVGKLLKFSKGDYTAGETNEEVPEGTQMVANMDALLVGWIKWESQRPVDHRMGRVADSFIPAKREELGNNDKAEWECDDRGDPRDPWQFSNYLLMRSTDPNEVVGDPEAGLYTFTTSSRGGINAVGLLCRKYGQLLRQFPGQYPVITLGVGSYRHVTYGAIKFPVFEIVGWTAQSVFDEPTDAALSRPEPDEPESPPPSPKTKSASQQQAAMKPVNKPARVAQPVAGQAPKSRF